MSVLITNDFQTFDESSNGFRVVVFTNASNRPEVATRLEELKTNNRMRVRKGTLRINDTTFENPDLYPPKFNNYNIILRATNANVRIYKSLETILATLASINKSATITIKEWNHIASRTAHFSRPSKFQSLFAQYNADVTNQTNAEGIVVAKVIKV